MVNPVKTVINIKKKSIRVDGLAKTDNQIKFFDLSLAKYVIKHKKASILFSKKGRTKAFFTQDSKLYITPEEYRRIQRGERLARIVDRLDSLHARVFENSKIYETGGNDRLQLFLRRKYAQFREYATNLAADSSQKITAVKLWNLSIVGAVIFGMFTMTMIYRYLGQGVSAQIQNNQLSSQEEVSQIATQLAEEEARVLGKTTALELNASIDADSITSLLSEENEKKNLEEEIREMVKGYPIEAMVPEIVKYERIVAAFIVGIAKKESGWGVRVPVYQGQDCFNYWGYRGKNPVGTGGHSCFSSPKDAVDTVAKRLAFLVANKKLNTPDKMVIWKCGSDCNATGGQAAANKWIKDVDMYFGKLNKK